MKKVVFATLLACAAIAAGLPSAAQQPVALGTAAPAAPCALPDAEYTAYNNAINQTDNKAKAAAIEAYLTAFPQSACPDTRPVTLVILMATYAALNDPANTLSTADRVLQVDPSNLRALFFETYLRKLNGDNATDPAAKQTAYDAAAGYAQKGLVATKPASMADADFKTLQDTAIPMFYSAIGIDDLTKKDTAGAIDVYKKELAYVPLAQTQTGGGQLPDTYELTLAYLQSTPPDLLDCAFYAARFVGFAPEPYKSQVAPTAKYCYKTFHGDPDDGYAAFAASAQANLFPPDGLFAGIKPAPTPAERIHSIIATTTDLGTLAIADKELVFQYGSPEDAAKVWDSIKGKSVEIPDALVVASTPTQLQVAVDDGAKQSKTADFTFNLAPPEEVPEPKPTATPLQKAAYKKAVAAAQKTADAVTAATAVGQTVTLDGVYDSYTPKPVMIVMSGGSVVLPKAAAATPAKPTVRRAPAPHN